MTEKVYHSLPFLTEVISNADAGKEKFTLGRLAEKIWNVRGTFKAVKIVLVSHISDQVIVKAAKKEVQSHLLTILKVISLVLLFPFFLAIKCIYRLQNKFLIEKVLQPKKTDKEIQEIKDKQLEAKAAATA